MKKIILALAFASIFATPAMAQVKISNLPSGGAIQTGDIIPAVRGPVTYGAIGGSMAGQDNGAVNITGGTINGTVIGNSIPAAVTGSSITGLNLSGTTDQIRATTSSDLAAGIRMQNSVQSYGFGVRPDQSENLTIRDLTNGIDILEIGPNSGNLFLNGTVPGLATFTLNGGTSTAQGSNVVFKQGGTTIGSIGNLAAVVGSGTSIDMTLQSQGANSTRLNSVNGNIIFSTGSYVTAMTVANSGIITANPIISGGTKFTISGCSAGTTVGGSTAGAFVSGTTGTCTVTITMNGATGATAPGGWVCHGNNLTTTANAFKQTGGNLTTAIMSGTTVSGDVMNFMCMGY